MVCSCCVEGCKNEKYPGSRYSFHCIPKNEDLKKQWLEAIRGKVCKSAAVCSAHFRTEDFTFGGRLSRLKPTAVPSVFPKSESNYVLPNKIPSTTSKKIFNMATPSNQEDSTKSTNVTDISQVCRVCMADCDTEPVLNKLAATFINLTGIQTYQDSLKDEMSIALCVCCWDDFYKCLEFKENALRANSALFKLKEAGKLTLENIRHLALTGNSIDIEFDVKKETGTLLSNDSVEEGEVKAEIETCEDEGNYVTFTDNELVENDELKETQNDRQIQSDSEDIEYFTKEEYLTDSEHDTVEDDQPLLNIKSKQTNTHLNNTFNDKCATDNEQETLTDDDEPLLKKLLTNKKPTKTKLIGKKKTIDNKEKEVNKQTNKNKRNANEEKQVNRQTNNANEKRWMNLSEHFTLSELNETEQRSEFEKRKLDEFYLNKNFKCLFCYRAFVSQETFDRHVEQQHTELPDRPYKCKLCTTYFKKKCYLTQHLALHSQQFKCKQCNFITEKRSLAELHVFWHQGKVYECKHCSKTFKRRSTLYNHQRIEHAADCVCALCGYSFVSDWGLQCHLKRLHSSSKDVKAPENGPKCVECKIIFVSEDALDTHKKVSPKHDDNSERMRNDATANNYREPYVRRNCSNPSKLEPRTDVIDPNNALQRRRGSMRNQNVQCEKCGELLPTFFAYNKHFNKAHPGEVRTQFSRLSKQLLCDHCGKVFRSKAYLRDHMNKHNKLTIRCTDCSKSFYSRLAFALHRKTHLGVKYPCKLCGKTFTRHANRERHAVTVHNVRSIKCNFCDKYFKSEEVQKIHIEHVHYNKPWPKRVRNKDGRRTVVRSECD